MPRPRLNQPSACVSRLVASSTACPFCWIVAVIRAPRSRVRRSGALAGADWLVSELADDAVAEGRQVVRGAARGEVAVGDDLLVDDVGARVAEIGAQARERGQAATTDDPGLQQRPRAVADRRGRLAGLDEG